MQFARFLFSVGQNKESLGLIQTECMHERVSCVACQFFSGVVPKSDRLPESDLWPRERAQQPVER